MAHLHQENFNSHINGKSHANHNKQQLNSGNDSHEYRAFPNYNHPSLNETDVSPILSNIDDSSEVESSSNENSTNERESSDNHSSKKSYNKIPKGKHRKKNSKHYKDESIKKRLEENKNLSPNRFRTTSRTSQYENEEICNKQNVICPTCQGKGKLTQDQADSMVALIPVRDQRLKPRRTKLYLTVTFVIALVVIALATFFMLPRSVTLNISSVTSTFIFMPLPEKKKLVPYIDVDMVVSIKNDNFFSAKMKDFGTDVTWNKFLLNTTILKGTKDFSIDGRSKKLHGFTIRQYFQGDSKSKIKGNCATGWIWDILEMFVSTAKVSYLSRSEEISTTFYGYVKCFNSSSNSW